MWRACVQVVSCLEAQRRAAKKGVGKPTTGVGSGNSVEGGDGQDKEGGGPCPVDEMTALTLALSSHLA